MFIIIAANLLNYCYSLRLLWNNIGLSVRWGFFDVSKTAMQQCEVCVLSFAFPYFSLVLISNSYCEIRIFFPATVACLRVRLNLTKPLAGLGSSRIMNDPCSNWKHCWASVLVQSVWSIPGPPGIVTSLICSICIPFNIKQALQALKVNPKGNIFIATLPKSNCICTSQFNRPLKALSGDLCPKPWGNWVRLQPIEHHGVLKVNENSSLWVDLSNQESSSPLPGVTSSLLVSIKDDELEREGEERRAPTPKMRVIRMIKRTAWRF